MSEDGVLELPDLPIVNSLDTPDEYTGLANRLLHNELEIDENWPHSSFEIAADTVSTVTVAEPDVIGKGYIDWTVTTARVLYIDAWRVESDRLIYFQIKSNTQGGLPIIKAYFVSHNGEVMIEFNEDDNLAEDKYFRRLLSDENRDKLALMFKVLTVRLLESLQRTAVTAG